MNTAILIVICVVAGLLVGAGGYYFIARIVGAGIVKKAAEEAEVVKLIFDLYEHGISVPEITRMLKEKGYPMPNGEKKVWDESRIHYMIMNEKYAGDLRTQKFYKKSYLEYRCYRNDGLLPGKMLKNHHEPIIPRKQFDR
jgi:hypothetical protein